MFPKMVRIRQNVPAPEIADVYGTVMRSVTDFCASNRVIPFKGRRIGITAGSRGIYSIPLILRAVVDYVKQAGGSPFLIPSMGTHGGATAEKQVELLESLGVTEESVGAPVIRCVDTVYLGDTESGVPVHVNKATRQVDALIVVNRVKAHTDFSGEIESGLCKMFAIGLGSYTGATTTHSHALVKGYEQTITQVAGVMMKHLPVAFGVAIIENWKGKTAKVEVVTPGRLIERERELLREAKSLSIKLPVKKIDVLVIDEIGKNISGTGMDTKVVGRIMVIGQKEPDEPKITRIVALDLTAEAHGNATGIGLADITTKRLFEKVDMAVTSLNCVGSMSPEQGRIPVVVETDRDAVRAALDTLGAVDPAKARVIHIRNTLFLEEMEASESLLDEMKSLPYIEVLGQPADMRFGEDGSIVRM